MHPPTNAMVDLPRYSKVMKTAHLLQTDISYQKSHLRKTKVCANPEPHDHNMCDFAHSMKEYRIPECYYAEFCKNSKCGMYHFNKMTPEEYIAKNNINFEKVQSNVKSVDNHRIVKLQPSTTSAFTRFCNQTSEGKPCTRKTCTFAHGISQLALPVSNFQCDCCTSMEKNLDENHYCKKRLSIATQMGYQIEPWMLKHHYNNIDFYVKRRKLSNSHSTSSFSSVSTLSNSTVDSVGNYNDDRSDCTDDNDPSSMNINTINNTINTINIIHIVNSDKKDVDKNELEEGELIEDEEVDNEEDEEDEEEGNEEEGNEEEGNEEDEDENQEDEEDYEMNDEEEEQEDEEESIIVEADPVDVYNNEAVNLVEQFDNVNIANNQSDQNENIASANNIKKRGFSLTEMFKSAFFWNKICKKKNE
jgi:hypothetical protein